MKLAVLSLADCRRLAIVNTEAATAAVVPEDLVPAGPDPLVTALTTAGCWASLTALAADQAGRDGLPVVSLESARICAPVQRPGKIICLASNYQAHMDEAGMTRAGHDPWFFMKPGSSVIGPAEQIVVPYPGAPVDWEVELCAVIGKYCRRAEPAQALEYVAGLTVGNDISLRQLDSMRPADHWDEFFSWQLGKWQDTFAPLGPWLVTRDEIGDAMPLRLTLQVNSQLRQDGSTAEMITGLPEIIAGISAVTALEPGDVIMTGTPSGVGASQGVYLVPGDLVEAAVEGIGTLRNTVAAHGEEQGS